MENEDEREYIVSDEPEEDPENIDIMLVAKKSPESKDKYKSISDVNKMGEVDLYYFSTKDGEDREDDGDFFGTIDDKDSIRSLIKLFKVFIKPNFILNSMQMQHTLLGAADNGEQNVL